MADIKGRPNHIEDYLVSISKGRAFPQWFGWSNSKNKIYANLVIHDGGSKPSEADCTNGLKTLQDAWDLRNAEDSYQFKRRYDYPSLAEQLDLLYKDITAGKVDATGEFAKSLKSTKDKYPKS